MGTAGWLVLNWLDVHSWLTFSRLPRRIPFSIGHLHTFYDERLRKELR